MIPAFIADQANRKRRGKLDEENRVGAAIGYSYEVDDFVDDDDDDDFVLESKGASPPPNPSPMEQAQAQIELERTRSQLEQQALERQQALDLAEKNARIDKARPLQQQAYQSAQGYGDQQVGARGYDQGLVNKYGLLDLYGTSVDNARLGVQEDDLNPMLNYNTKTMFNDALNTVLGTYRGDLTRDLNTIAPEDYGYNVFANTADDSILGGILDQGRSDALAQIDSAKARGQLNDVGYSRALTQLDNQAQAGMADLQDLGGGVLSGYRDQLGSLRNDWLDRIGTADFSNPMNFDMFSNRLNQTTSDLNNRMRGDIFRATQGQSFFDPSTIISGSGAVQGFYNPTGTAQKKSGGVTNPLLDAFTNNGSNTQQQTGQNGVF